MRTEILVNATPPETRVALTEEGRLVEVFHERRHHQGLVGNVYLGRVQRVLPGMHAAFISIGLDRQAFLYVEDAVSTALELEIEAREAKPNGADWNSETSRPRIDDLLKEGQEIVVQITKDPLSGKGPRVTANLSLPGRTLVYLPGARDVAISRRITDEEERERLRRILESWGGPGGYIARTAAQGSSEMALETDRGYLLGLAERLQKKSERGTAPLLLHRELDLPLRIVRDLGREDVAIIRVDDEETHARLTEFLKTACPPLVPRLDLDRDGEPLFDRFGIESEIESALQSHVPLPSGGSVVIHQTEALVAIDVNTGKFVGRDALEETVHATNLEAIPEIARQIRLRDLGGLLVVDFIDMEDEGHRREIFEKFEAELARDRARTRLLPISEFGLIEITRQRSRGNLEKTLTRTCPICDGTGRVKTDLSMALDLRRELEGVMALYSPGETVQVRVRPSLAALADEEPALFTDLTEKTRVKLDFLADEGLSVSAYEVLRR
ncbi:MAG TPA: Rne/Rng family ribonuclease [Thermoanaerobaculia bacterium]